MFNWLQTNISKSFTYKMAPKISWHRYVTKLRQCHYMYNAPYCIPWDSSPVCQQVTKIFRTQLQVIHLYQPPVFTARCYASAVLAMGLCLCSSVGLCLCLSQAGVLLKQQNVGSHKQHHTTPRDSSFLMPKISAKCDRGHPYGGTKCRWGGSKSATFHK